MRNPIEALQTIFVAPLAVQAAGSGGTMKSELVARDSLARPGLRDLLARLRSELHEEPEDFDLAQEGPFSERLPYVLDDF